MLNKQHTSSKQSSDKVVGGTNHTPREVVDIEEMPVAAQCFMQVCTDGKTCSKSHHFCKAGTPSSGARGGMNAPQSTGERRHRGGNEGHESQA